MVRPRLLIVSTFVLAATRFVGAVPLEHVIKEALHQSTAVQKAQAQRDLMRQKRREKHASQWGSVDMVGSYTHYNMPRTLAPLTPAIMKDPATAANVATTEDLFTTGARYTVPLFTGFAVTEDIRIAELAEKTADSNIRLSKEEIVYNVSSMYVTVLSLKETAKAQQHYIDALHALYKTVKKSVDVGKKAPLDLLKIQTQIAQARASLASVKGNIASLKAAIEATANVTIDRFEPVRVRMDKTRPLRNAKRADLASLLKLKAAKLKTLKAERAVKKSKSAYYPHVALAAYYGYNYGENDPSNPKSGEWANEELWQIGLNVEWNVFDFGARDSRTQQAKISALQARIDEVQTSRELKKMLAQAVAKLEENYEAWHAAAKQYQTARESARIEAVRYENGASSINDLLYAKANALMAKASKIRYRYEWKKAEYFLNYLLERGVKQ